MAPPRKTGVNRVTKRKADGATVTYFYDRATGRSLGTDEAKAISAATGTGQSTAAAPGSFDALATAYLASGRYRRLGTKTQKLNRFYIDRLRDLYGRLPAASITRPVVIALGEASAERPWYGTHMLSKLRLVLQYGVDTGVLKANPALRPGGLGAPRRHSVWTLEQTAMFLDAARGREKLALALLLYTAQRPSDVLSMERRHVSDRNGRLWVSLRQRKTGELIDVPCHRDLDPMIRERLKEQDAAMAAGTPWSVLLIPSPREKPWQYRNFCRSWDRTRQRADFRLAKALFRQGANKEDIRPRLMKGNMQRRDLRRTGMVRMAEAGATTAQIAGVSGHTIAQTSAILDTYIPRRGEVAAGAIEAWEAHTTRVVAIPMNVPTADVPTSANYRVRHRPK